VFAFLVGMKVAVVAIPSSSDAAGIRNAGIHVSSSLLGRRLVVDVIVRGRHAASKRWVIVISDAPTGFPTLEQVQVNAVRALRTAARRYWSVKESF